MAPVMNKRKRIEEEVRPKKKSKPVKRQTEYHSSSEDEDEDLSTRQIIPRASDAPKPNGTKSAQPGTRLDSLSVSAAKVASKPKSILKEAPPPAGAIVESNVDHQQLGMDELARNTALNGGVQLSDSDDEEMVTAEEELHSDADSESDTDIIAEDEDEDEDEIASVSDTSMTSSQAARARKKRNDPDAFATSMSRILDTKLSTSKRRDPVLSRSKSAAEANKQLADSKLEQRAKAQIRAEKKAASEKGRVKDVLGLETADVDTGALMEEEKRLKKTAQRGVVKLFNAVRAAQVKAEEAMKQARLEGVVGMQKREEKVNEMSKQGFLDLISSGGKKGVAAAS